jgi:Domain of unknown function (DUF3870)
LKKTVMLAGHSKLPQGMAISEIHQILTVTMEVDSTYGVVIDASCTLATGHAQNFIGELVKGYSLRDGIEPILHAIKNHYYGKAQSALIAAVKDAYKQYTHYHPQE